MLSEASSPDPYDEIDPYELSASFGAKIYFEDEGDPPSTKPVGILSGTLIDYGGIINAHESAFEIFDSISQNTCDLHGAIFSDHDDLREDVQDICVMGPNHILLLEMFTIDKKHRGVGVGLATLREVIKCAAVPNYTLIMLKPFAVGKKGRRLIADSVKLAEYWKRAGFVELEETEYLYYFKE